MIWQRHEVPNLGIHYEYGLHLSHKVVPIDKFLSDRKWRKYRKRHYPPVPAATTLQSACLRALHRSSGPWVVRHYHLQHISNVPLLFAHSYVYEIYTKSDPPTPDLVNCYTLQLVIKYGADYDSPWYGSTGHALTMIKLPALPTTILLCGTCMIVCIA